MAASPTPRNVEARGDAPRRVGVAVSGGRDSTALWHLTARLAARLNGLEVVAMHVHHGLQAEADAWLAHLRQQAARWATRGLPVRLLWQRLQGAPGGGDSVEAWARRERYTALTRMAHEAGIDCVLLAHHRRDQAETFLLQALRGAGPVGLAAMPRSAHRDGIVWARPWLDQPREAIEQYVRSHRLRAIEDPSNADTRWARSRLRLHAMPALQAAFADAETCLSASARRAQEAAACLEELAQIDSRRVGTADGALDVALWRALSAPRQANLLRHWLHERSGQGAAQSLVQRLLVELPDASASRWPLPGGEVRCHAGRLRFEATPLPKSWGAPAPLKVDLYRPGRVEVPQWHGAFEVREVRRDGLALQRLQRAELRARSGGERFQGSVGSSPRSLKKQFQAAGVAPWHRIAPLVYADGALLYVPGLGIDARALALPGQPMVALRWIPSALRADRATGAG